MPDTDKSSNAPSLWRQIFVTPFTPTWTLGLLLFLCLFLPSYRGCNNEVVYLKDVFDAPGWAVGDLYTIFLVTWPIFLGLLIAMGTLWLISGRGDGRARGLWLLLSIPIIVNMGFLVAACLVAEPEGQPPNVLADLWEIWWLLVPSFALPILLCLTLLRCRTWYAAAMWLQLGVVIVAMFSVSILTPGLILARELLIGGHLASAAVALLILTTIVQLLDGRRVLARRRHESPLQLSLRAMLLLMLLSGVLCGLVGGGWIVETNEPVVEQEATSPSAESAADASAPHASDAAPSTE